MDDQNATFQGAPCKHGHPGLRFSSDHQCVCCRRSRYVKRDRPSRSKPPEPVIATSPAQAKLLGHRKYHGRPCKCGATVRYAVNSRCVACACEQEMRRHTLMMSRDQK